MHPKFQRADELKAVTQVLPSHKAQLLSYMKLLDVPVGLLINFHEMRLIDGVHRLILQGADANSQSHNSQRPHQK